MKHAVIYEFEDIDLGKYVKKITIDDFWNSKGAPVIHCSTKAQAEVLLKVFRAMGKTWSDGKKFSPKKTGWETYKSATCYYNRGRYSDLGFEELAKTTIYEFDEVDLSGYLYTDKKSTDGEKDYE